MKLRNVLIEENYNKLDEGLQEIKQDDISCF